MVRAAKSKAAAEPETPSQASTQTRTRRTPKPNPKYAEEIAKEAGETPEGGEKSIEQKKSGKKGDSTGKGKAGAAKKAPVVKKQKLDLDDEETSSSKERPDEEPPVKATGRATRSGKAEDSLKVGEESVALVDVSSIVEKKTPAAADPIEPTNRSLRGRKRGNEDSPAEEAPKKKKESESEKDQPARPSAITTRKSYLPAGAKKPDVKVEVKVEPKVEVKSPVLTGVKVATRTSLGSPKEAAEVKVEVKKQLPLIKKVIVSPQQQTRQVGQTTVKSPINVVTRIVSTQSKPVPRILNSMISKDKQSPTIKLTGDGRDKKVFSIDLTDDSIKERKVISPVKTITSGVKPSPYVRNPIGVGAKENVVRTPPADLLKNTLVSELSKMKASANMYKRNVVTTNTTTPSPNNNIGSRRITRFESWFVIDVKPTEVKPFRHTHTFPLIRLGNNISELKLPSNKWEFKISLQKRAIAAKDGDEVYNGDISDKTESNDKSEYEPVNILFKRSHNVNNRTQIDRSLMLKSNLYTITINGKQCKLIGAPDDLKSLEDIEILLDILDSNDLLSNKCIELVTADDVKMIHAS